MESISVDENFEVLLDISSLKVQVYSHQSRFSRDMMYLEFVLPMATVTIPCTTSDIMAFGDAVATQLEFGSHMSYQFPEQSGVAYTAMLNYTQTDDDRLIFIVNRDNIQCLYVELDIDDVNTLAAECVAYADAVDFMSIYRKEEHYV